MPPTAAQVYLAADLFTALPATSDDAASMRLRGAAAKVLYDALTSDAWTGKTDTCAEYGKPPSIIDPDSQEAVRRLTAVRMVLSLPIGGVEKLQRLDEALS